MNEVYGPGLTFEDLDVDQREALRMCDASLQRDLNEYRDQDEFSHPSMFIRICIREMFRMGYCIIYIDREPCVSAWILIPMHQGDDSLDK